MSLDNYCNRELKYYLVNNKALEKSPSNTAQAMKPNVISYQLYVFPSYVMWVFIGLYILQWLLLICIYH
jgi:hypothetical protein